MEVAADAAIITHDNASSEDASTRRVESLLHLTADLVLFDKEEGTVRSPKRGLMTPRSEALMDAVVKQARTTRHPTLVAFDANMDTRDF